MCDWSNKGVNYSAYYKKMKSEYAELREKVIEDIEKAEAENIKLRDELMHCRNSFIVNYGITLIKIDDFVQDTYCSGQLYKVAKGAMIKYADNYEKMYELNTLLKYATNQKNIYDNRKKLVYYDKCLALSARDYRNLVYTFYSKVQEKMILEGYGYAFEGRLGWTCINRCSCKKPTIDYAATRKKKEELIKAGIRPFNQKEYDWAKQHGVPYEGKRYRVMVVKDHNYEIPLLNCNIKDRGDCRLYNINHVDDSLKSKSFDEIAEEYKDDLVGAARLHIDLAHKLAICLKIDSSLSDKYKRNDEELSYSPKAHCTAKIDRQD